MVDPVEAEQQLEVAISHLLRGGVVVSALVLGAGWGLIACGSGEGPRVMGVGVRVLMSTPILRVAATFVLFVRQRDTSYVAITAVVLILLAVGLIGGLHL